MTEKTYKIIQDDEIDVRVLFQVIWRGKKTIIWLTLLFTLFGVLYAVLTTPLYKSNISIYPSNSETGNLRGLSGMAANFGFDIGGSATDFHIPDIVESRRLKDRILEHHWYSSNLKDTTSLITLWKIDEEKFSLNPMNWIAAIFEREPGNLQLIWEAEALEMLNERISVKEDKSGLVVVSVWMEEPQLAADIANFIRHAISDYTVSVHSTQAGFDRNFIEKRQAEVETALTSAEETLKRFRERNRMLLESPQLQLEMERLMREVEIQTQVYITLQQQYELARIEEVKESPSVIILDEAKPDVEKDKPKRKLIVILSLFLGGMISVFVVLIRHSIRQGRESE